MAVRIFDPTEPQSPRLRALEAVPRRQALRRAKHHYVLVGAAVLAVPFFSALIALGVAH